MFVLENISNLPSSLTIEFFEGLNRLHSPNKASQMERTCLLILALIVIFASLVSSVYLVSVSKNKKHTYRKANPVQPGYMK